MRGSRFIERLQAGENPLVVLTGDHEGLLAAGEAPEALAVAMAELTLHGPVGAADIEAPAFTGAAFNLDGSVVAGDPLSVADWETADDELASLAQRALRSGSTVSGVVAGRPVAVAAAEAAAGWPLPAEAVAALAGGRAAFAALAMVDGGTAAAHAGRALGLTGLETRLLIALAREGAVPDAAAAAGVSYTTARSSLRVAMAKTGAAKAADLVRRFTQLAAGEVPAHPEADALFADVYALSPRQARLARLVAAGCSREEAATAAGVSASTVKAELKVVHAACDVTGSAGLARLVAEVETLVGLAAATDVALAHDFADGRLRLVTRASGGGRIAVEDHGPPGGVPVFLVHAVLMGRHQPRLTVAALQAAGFRPLCVERPGFGLTDLGDDDAYAQAADDAARVLDAFGLQCALVVARCGGAGGAYAARHPARFPGGVILNPPPAQGGDRFREGTLGALKAVFQSDGPMRRLFGNLVGRWVAQDAVERVLRQSIAACAQDRAALENPENLADLARSVRQGLTHAGRGFLAAEARYARGWVPPIVAESAAWTLLAGTEDGLHRLQDSIDAWTLAMPDADVLRLRGHGRFLHLTAMPEIVKTLQRAAVLQRLA